MVREYTTYIKKVKKEIEYEKELRQNHEVWIAGT